LIGGACFGAGVLFSRNRQIPTSSSGSATQASVAVSASQPGKSEPSANDPLSKSSFIPPATATVAEGPAHVIRDTPKHTGHEQFVHQPRMPDSTSPHIQKSKRAAISAAPQQTPPASYPLASNSSPASSVSSPAFPNPAVPASVQIPVGSISFFLRFRAIRNPGDSSNRPAGGVLQIGPLLSSSLPAYPVDAQRRQIQGLVELDVMVGSEGNVQSVHLVKGPAELAAVAMSAVRDWHYGPTVLGGHPVATEQSIFFTFKLGK
jgi:periplasmic protein TonB